MNKLFRAPKCTYDYTEIDLHTTHTHTLTQEKKLINGSLSIFYLNLGIFSLYYLSVA